MLLCKIIWAMQSLRYFEIKHLTERAQTCANAVSLDLLTLPLSLAVSLRFCIFSWFSKEAAKWSEKEFSCLSLYLIWQLKVKQWSFDLTTREQNDKGTKKDGDMEEKRGDKRRRELKKMTLSPTYWKARNCGKPFMKEWARNTDWEHQYFVRPL